MNARRTVQIWTFVWRTQTKILGDGANRVNVGNLDRPWNEREIKISRWYHHHSVSFFSPQLFGPDPEDSYWWNFAMRTKMLANTMFVVGRNLWIHIKIIWNIAGIGSRFEFLGWESVHLNLKITMNLMRHPPTPKNPSKITKIEPMGQGWIVCCIYLQRGLFRTLT